MHELIAIAGVSLTGAAMTVTVLVLGAAEELIPARNAMFIRLPALMLASLVMGSVGIGLFAACGASVGTVRTAVLLTFATCLGELLFLSVFLLRVPVFITVLDGRYWAFANSRHIWVMFTLFVSAAFALVAWYTGFAFRPSAYGASLTIGWLLSLLFMFPYVQHGFGGYEELFTAGQFYDIMEQRIEEILSLRAASQTPGLLLPTEADPVASPLPGRSKHPARSRLFETYRRYATHGLRMYFLIDEKRLTEELEAYYNARRYDYIRKVQENVRTWEDPLSTVRFRLIDNHYRPYVATGGKLHEYSGVAETADGEGMVIKTARGPQARIRHAVIIRSQRLVNEVMATFDEAWECARPLTSTRLTALLTRAGIPCEEFRPDESQLA